MGLTKTQQIGSAINLLENNGYIVLKDYSSLVGKWVTFRQEGMEPILHGKIIRISEHNCLVVRCKNNEKRFPSIDDIIDFYDNKKDCYKVK